MEYSLRDNAPQKERYTICRLVSEFPPIVGGSAIQAAELYNRIKPYCRRQLVIAPNANVDSQEFDKQFPFEIYRINYFQFPWLHWFKDKYLKWLPLNPLVTLSYGLFALPLIFRLNKNYGIDIIHAEGISAGIIASVASKLIKKPAVWTLHGSLEAYSRISGIYETIATILFTPKHVIVLDDGSIAPKKFTDLLRGKVTILYHGIDTKIFSPNTSAKDIDYILDIVRAKFIIMSTHSLIPVKCVEYAILSFQEFLKISNSTNAVLLVIGDGMMRNQLEKLVLDLGIDEKVIFMGEIDHSYISNYLSIADIFVGTSLYSNLNLSIQEAMACGKPVVVFNSGGTDKIIQHMETGLLVEPGNIKDFAEKLLILYKNQQLRKNIGNSARNHIIKNRGWDRRVEEELSIYRKIL